MQKLIDGIDYFQRNIFSHYQNVFHRLTLGQQPLALVITCSDSQIHPSLLTQTGPGELFILRNAGNLVPPFGSAHGGEAATIEYAVATLKVPDIIICGHSYCGAMTSLIHPEKCGDSPTVHAWLANAEATLRIIHQNYNQLVNDQERVTKAAEENVIVQLQNLRTHPSVAAALSRHELKLHGWIYCFETGQVSVYVPQLHRYLPLEQVYSYSNCETMEGVST
ncbi:carbonic anhydrase [Bythopirellula goksoeyrii]|uniref:Carbonic anhydrase n=1 Tax=Bythopirellula goksoeyrii TaxID=1400387 RepID=A0A5B9QG12_9BACT|nr:carbonic anhydrase [Bythopirellula goksoeyrii]QEG35866.1 Carbonic anhydrase 1 [Bythopirellula goksoeyrii]